MTTIRLDIDPMILLKEEKKQRSIKYKIERTGLTESHCKKCDKTKSIGEFDVYRTGKNTHRPRLICMKCREEGITRVRNKSYRNSIKVRKTVKRSAQTARQLLTDAYIRRLYNQHGFKAKDVTSEMIIKKRSEIIERRENAINNPWKKKRAENAKIASEELKDSYIIKVIKGSAFYNGEEITPEMIQQKRDKILLERMIKNRGKNKEKKPYTFFVPKEVRD